MSCWRQKLSIADDSSVMKQGKKGMLVAVTRVLCNT